MLALIRRTEGKLEREELTPCVFVPLIGDGGWDEHSSAVSGSDARPSEEGPLSVTVQRKTHVDKDRTAYP